MVRSQQLLVYVAGLVPQIADDIADVDLAMRTGFNWKRRPFEMIDQLGAAWLADKLVADKIEISALLAGGRKTGRILQEECEQFIAIVRGWNHRPIKRPAEAFLLLTSNCWSAIGQECIGQPLGPWRWRGLPHEFESKMNSIDPDTLEMVSQAIEIVGKGHEGVGSIQRQRKFLRRCQHRTGAVCRNIGVWPVLEELVMQGQQVMKSLKFAPFPVVAAPSGMALGGGWSSFFTVLVCRPMLKPIWGWWKWAWAL